jgi:hypothetical protein
MHRALVVNAIRTVLPGVLALWAAGCTSSWPKPVGVALDKGLTQDAAGVPSVDVHLVGVAGGPELKRYREMSVSDYWAPGGPSRQPLPARKALSLGPGATSKTVAANDPVWKEWKAREYLVVLADLRGVGPRDAEDPRRVVLPLKKKRWPGGTKQIRINVLRDRVVVATPPKPPR